MSDSRPVRRSDGGSPARTRWGAAALAAAAVMFVLYPAVRPWKDESTVAGATAAMSWPAWVASHLSAIVGFILVPLGLLALRGVLASGRAGRVAVAGLLVFWIGVGLTLPYHRAEDFGLNAIARRAPADRGVGLLDLIEAVRFGPTQIATFLLGLTLLAVGAVIVAVAVWTSRTLPRASGILFTLGFVMFLPQFFAPPALRIGHGALLGVSLLWLALILWRAATPAPCSGGVATMLRHVLHFGRKSMATGVRVVPWPAPASPIGRGAAVGIMSGTTICDVLDIDTRPAEALGFMITSLLPQHDPNHDDPPDKTPDA